MEYGSKVWVEETSEIFKSGVHTVKRHDRCGKVLEDNSGRHYHISLSPNETPNLNKWYRVWLLPQPPTAEELAANPWPKEDK